MKFQQNERQPRTKLTENKEMRWTRVRETTPFPTADINEKASASPVLFIITSLLFLKREKQAPQEKLQATDCKETKKGLFLLMVDMLIWILYFMISECVNNYIVH